MTNNCTWEERFCQLETWRNIYGHCRIPKAEGALGRWVARQRELRKRNKLSASRLVQLDGIGFTWEVIASAWEEKHKQLVEWKNIHGHTCVPISDEQLGSWVSKQRQSRKRNKLSHEKIALLDQLGFTWSTSDADWAEKFQQLRLWKSVYGHANVPFNEGGLGWWANTQRQNKRKGKISKTRKSLLNDLGFVWIPSIAKRSSRSESPGACSRTRFSASHLPYDRLEDSRRTPTYQETGRTESSETEIAGEEGTCTYQGPSQSHLSATDKLSQKVEPFCPEGVCWDSFLDGGIASDSDLGATSHSAVAHLADLEACLHNPPLALEYSSSQKCDQNEAGYQGQSFIPAKVEFENQLLGVGNTFEVNLEERMWQQSSKLAIDPSLVSTLMSCCTRPYDTQAQILY